MVPPRLSTVAGLLSVFAAALPAPAAELPRLWIILPAPDLRPAMEELAAHRKAEGYTVVTLDSTLTADGTKAREAIAAAAAGTAGQVFVVLAGTPDPQAPPGVRLPALTGTHGRMARLTSDHGYSRPGKDGMPSLAVGRLPAVSADEAKAMVAKIKAFENLSGSPDARSRLSAMIGHPGGEGFQRAFAERYVNNAVGERIQSLHPRWTPRVITDVPGSPWLTEKSRLEPAFLEEAKAGALFFVYMGHSGPPGFFSDGLMFMQTRSWKNATFTGNGVFFTCGCEALFPPRTNPGGRGFNPGGHGYSAMRNPAGPAAVIGAVDISYSAAGQLAFDGFLTLLQKDNPPALLATWWLAAMQGIVSGKIDASTFAMLDLADGSQGQTPLDAQRLEHAEMWQLLGDPATRLPLVPATLKLTGPDRVPAGAPIRITAELPAGTPEGTFTFTVETAPGVPLSSAQANSSQGVVKASLPLPADLTTRSAVVRAFGSPGGTGLMGALRIPLE